MPINVTRLITCVGVVWRAVYYMYVYKLARHYNYTQIIIVVLKTEHVSLGICTCIYV
jgi:hypothetical protein